MRREPAEEPLCCPIRLARSSGSGQWIEFDHFFADSYLRVEQTMRIDHHAYRKATRVAGFGFLLQAVAAIILLQPDLDENYRKVKSAAFDWPST